MVAEMQPDLIFNNPYNFTSDDIFFQVFADKTEYKQAREQFFSKRQPCFRASLLTKTYGYDVYNDSNGKIAIVGLETVEYQKFLADEKIKKIKAMKSNK